MEIRPYRGKHSGVAQLLYEKGVIQTLPKQIDRADLERDDGVDIIFRFKNMNPAKFAEYADTILLAAFTEAERYKDVKYKFAKFEVELNRNAKGRRSMSPRRTYCAGKNADSDVMVYGEQIIGPIPAEARSKPFLVNKIEEILGIPDSASPGAYVKKQRPFKVVTMVVSVRSGILEKPDYVLSGEQVEEIMKRSPAAQIESPKQIEKPKRKVGPGPKETESKGWIQIPWWKQEQIPWWKQEQIPWWKQEQIPWWKQRQGPRETT